MKILELHYERVHNLGNYETERIKAIATVDSKDNPAKAYAELKRWAEIQLGIRKKPSKEKIKCAKKVIAEAGDWEDEDLHLFSHEDINC